MIPATVLLSIGLFIYASQRFGVFRAANRIQIGVKEAAQIFREKQLDDKAREKAIQDFAKQLFGSFLSILIRSTLTLLVSFLPIWSAGLAGLLEIDDVSRYLLRWDVIGINSVLIIAGFLIYMRPRQGHPSPAGHQINYSFLDRLLHRIVFSSPTIQFTAANIEKSSLSPAYQAVAAGKPIFITSLPRAGTTILLEILHRFPSLASHIYRDMPLVMAPVLWSRFSSSFRKGGEARERAHGDGIFIDYDSPEAFEEVIWRAFWPEKYRDDGIALFTAADIKSDAQEFFTEHMKKIIALRRPDRLHDGRYISKNNGNMARIDLIEGMFPEADILVPVRHPLRHAASLLRQHIHFLEMHKKNDFVRRYMADIGHYEFGELHRPIGFPGTEKMLSGKSPLHLDYWLGYWISAFHYVLENKEKVTIFSYDAACLGGLQAIDFLCDRLSIPKEEIPSTAASVFKTPSPSRYEIPEPDTNLRKDAEELYEALLGCQKIQ